MDNAEKMRRLAQQVLIDRLNRAEVVGTTKKGRVIVELRGEPTEAEKQWVALQEHYANERKNRND